MKEEGESGRAGEGESGRAGDVTGNSLQGGVRNSDKRYRSILDQD
jgi:hypothetical protein